MVLSCHFRAPNFRKVCVIADSNLVLVETSGKTTTKPPHVTNISRNGVLDVFKVEFTSSNKQISSGDTKWLHDGVTTAVRTEDLVNSARGRRVIGPAPLGSLSHVSKMLPMSLKSASVWGFWMIGIEPSVPRFVNSFGTYISHRYSVCLCFCFEVGSGIKLTASASWVLRSQAPAGRFMYLIENTVP